VRGGKLLPQDQSFTSPFEVALTNS